MCGFWTEFFHGFQIMKPPTLIQAFLAGSGDEDISRSEKIQSSKIYVKGLTAGSDQLTKMAFFLFFFTVSVVFMEWNGNKFIFNIYKKHTFEKKRK